ncbi:MAG: Nif3-like dinuclear metal center hexameric protein [Burkholderiales bacterium]|nr:Nif3-like dinuclear metal center hexameric protein [Burkholderiales bacterium]
MDAKDLLAALEVMLEPAKFRDYCPNGLQVEGKPVVQRLVTGVTASLALVEAAVAAGADALLVHHGLFWKGDDMRIIGPRRRRLGMLLGNDLNLYAYHLPLDAHAELGNNAQLGRRLGVAAETRFGDQDLGFAGTLAVPASAGEFAAVVERALDRPPLLVGDAARQVRRIGWCSGGAQGYFEAAIAAGCDLFLSGEISEQTTHLARESGVTYLAAGHHATERYGVAAVGAHISARFGIEHLHIDIDNPA